jgi:hypothetical protein
MWFRNRLVNPVVRWLLRSPLHPLLSRSLVILSYQGRKTGRWRSLPCMYARDGQDLNVIPGQPDRKVWWRNLRQPTQVRLRLQGRDREGTATASSDPETVAAGLRHYLARYPKTAKPLRVRLDPRRHGHRPPPAGRGQRPPGRSDGIDRRRPGLRLVERPLAPLALRGREGPTNHGPPGPGSSATEGPG